MIQPFAQTRPKGFTLLELMVVIAIIGIIMAVALPNFSALQQRQRIRAAAGEIAQDFRQIRERALAMSQEFRVTSPNPYEYQVTHPSGRVSVYKLGHTSGGNLFFGTTNAAGAPPEDDDGAPGNFDFPLGILFFESRGGASRGVAYITDGKQDYAIGVNSIGKIHVYKYENGVWN
jgi:prepilin-type N-terminal cleavage/methylation domain-containing protein